MFNEKSYKSRIGARINCRNAFMEKKANSRQDPTEQDFWTAILMISESFDDYIEHRIEADKVLEGILKDIQGNIASIAENGIAMDRRKN